jgi:hypothetical protein
MSNYPTDTVLIDGYTVTIATDDCSENPLSAWGCEPPTLTYCEGLTEYNDAPEIGDLVALIPSIHFVRHNRVKLIREWLNCSLREFAEERRERLGKESDRETFAYLLFEECPKPDSYRSWGSTSEYFDCLESLAKLAGVPCYNGKSNGYCQGHSALVIVFATPDWVKEVGFKDPTPELLAGQCKATFDLYSAWAWGDVYGIESITDPDGEELEDGSVWGFYGSDHEKSGLLDSARHSIEYAKEYKAKAIAAEIAYEAKESAERAYWESRDLATV